MNGGHPGPSNIGNPVGFTTRQRAELVLAKINKNTKLVPGLIPCSGNL